MVEDPARKRPADHERENRRRHEDRDGSGPVGFGKPVSDGEDQAREEPSLRRAQEEAKRIESPLAGHEHHRERNDTPSEHDAGDPDTGSDTLQKKVRRHFEKEISQEENPRARSIHWRREGEVPQHRELGEAHIYAVEERRHITDFHEGQQPPYHLSHHLAFERVGFHAVQLSTSRARRQSISARPTLNLGSAYPIPVHHRPDLNPRADRGA